MVARSARTHVRLPRDERVLAAAGGFTGLWAVTWLGTSVMAAGAVTQGAFAVGGVMSASGLTALWWKTRAVRTYHEAGDEDDDVARQERDNPQLAETHKG